MHIRQILEKYWYLSKSDSHLRDLIPAHPRMMFRRAHTIKKILAPAISRKTVKKNKSITTNKTHGSWKCSLNKCLCCKTIIYNVTTFKSNTTGETFSINQSLNFESSYVVYLLECTRSLQYVGCTSQARLNKHHFNITHAFEKHSVSRPAALKHNCRINDFLITPIEQVNIDTPNRMQSLSHREMYWIYKINTIVPYGLNESIENVF